MDRVSKRVTTIGVYGGTLDSFLAALRDADVRLLLDVSQRRGVRGSEYAWANAKRLEAELAEAGFVYEHHQELAPTKELRQLQYRADDRERVGKRSRTELAPEYVERYTREILGQVDLRALVEQLPTDGAAALLCVERDPEACHRSLIAERLEHEFGVTVDALAALSSETPTTSGTAAASSHHASSPSWTASAVAAIATTIPTATHRSSPTTKSTTAATNRLMPAAAAAAAGLGRTRATTPWSGRRARAAPRPRPASRPLRPRRPRTSRTT